MSEPKVESLQIEKYQIGKNPPVDLTKRDVSNFIGRQDVLRFFGKMLQKPYEKENLLNIEGTGGVGKTLLLRKLLEIAKSKDFLVLSEPIDLYSTDYRTIDGIQSRIVDSLDGQLARAGRKDRIFDEYKTPGRDTNEIFQQCLRNFCKQNPVIIGFDTFENVGQITREWLLSSDIGGLQVPGLICIVAGRPNGWYNEKCVN